MKKLVLVVGALGLVLVIILAILMFLLVPVISERFPHWVASGERIVGEVISEAGGTLPTAKEMAKEASPPGLAEKIKGLIPGDEIPSSDVAGEDIKPVPRYAGMVRVSYATYNQKRTVVYKGRANFRAVSDFYQKEMTALGFTRKVLGASPEEEIYEYRKGMQRLEFKFRKISTIHSEITELTIREL